MSDEAQITSGETTFAAGGKEVRGFLARPEGAERAPAVVVVHEWWGLSDHIKDVARRFARAGYIAAAPDLYDGVATRDEREASRLMGALPQGEGARLLQTVVADLRGRGEVTSVGVTGFCMGGTFALLLPCHTRLEAAAPFYGDVPADTSILARLSCPVLFVGGARTTGSQWTRWGAWTGRSRSMGRRARSKSTTPATPSSTTRAPRPMSRPTRATPGSRSSISSRATCAGARRRGHDRGAGRDHHRGVVGHRARGAPRCRAGAASLLLARSAARLAEAAEEVRRAGAGEVSRRPATCAMRPRSGGRSRRRSAVSGASTS